MNLITRNQPWIDELEILEKVGIHHRFDIDTLIPTGYGTTIEPEDTNTVAFKKNIQAFEELINVSNRLIPYNRPVTYKFASRDIHIFEREDESWNVKTVYDLSSVKDKNFFLYTRDNNSTEVLELGEFRTIQEVRLYLINYLEIRYRLVYIDRDWSYTEANPGLGTANIYNVHATLNEPSRIIALTNHKNFYITKGTEKENEELKKIFVIAEEEAELQIPFLKYKYIYINGVAFKSMDLRLFYNSFIYDTLLRTGESEIIIPNLSVQDLRLLRDTLTGRTSFLYFFQHISTYAYLQLSGERTLIDLFEFLPARYFIDLTFEIGKSLLESIQNIEVPRDVGVISRLEELVRISREN